jgi:hypothetical protein
MEGYGVTGLLFYTTRLAPVALQAEQLEWKRKGSVVSSAQQVAARSTQHAARSMELGGTPPTVAVAVTVTRDARKLRVKQKWAGFEASSWHRPAPSSQ